MELHLEALLDLLLGRGGAHEGAERGRALELVHLQVGLLDRERGAHDLADLILEDLVLVDAAHELGRLEGLGRVALGEVAHRGLATARTTPSGVREDMLGRTNGELAKGLLHDVLLVSWPI